jgi:hypothetical protein
LSPELNLYVDEIVDVDEHEVDFGIKDQQVFHICQMLEKNWNTLKHSIS